jgi:hypothetical protein
VVAVERPDARLVDQLHREVAVLDADGAQGGLRGPLEAGVGRPDELDLAQALRRAARSSGACFSAYSL